MRWPLLLVVPGVAGLVVLSSRGDAGVPLTVYAASSLRAAGPEIDPDARYQFASSGTLSLQIERGAPADVFASASLEEAQELERAGRCGRPRTFASNRLVLLVPAREGAVRSVRSVRDLRAGGRRLALAAQGVPVGDYTRQLLKAMGEEDVLRANTVSSELSPAGITAKVAAGSADAGFAYATDARAGGPRVRAIELPRRAQPRIRYAACAVRGDGADRERAERWIDALRSPRGRAILAEHGFGAP